MSPDLIVSVREEDDLVYEAQRAAGLLYHRPLTGIEEAQAWVDWILRQPWWKLSCPSDVRVEVLHQLRVLSEPGVSWIHRGLYRIVLGIGDLSIGMLDHEMAHVASFSEVKHHGPRYVRAHANIIMNTEWPEDYKRLTDELHIRRIKYRKPWNAK